MCYTGSKHKQRERPNTHTDTEGWTEKDRQMERVVKETKTFNLQVNVDANRIKQGWKKRNIKKEKRDGKQSREQKCMRFYDKMSFYQNQVWLINDQNGLRS